MDENYEVFIGDYQKVMNGREVFHTGLCRTTFKVVGEKRYYNRCTVTGEWAVTYPGKGYFESSHPASESIVFQIVDSDTNVLFEESNGNSDRTFIPVDEYIRAKAKEYNAKYGAQEYEQWKAFMTDCPEYSEYVAKVGCRDSWLFCEETSLDQNECETFKYLDEKYSYGIESVRHNRCGKEYKRCSVESGAGLKHEYGYIF